VTPFDSKPGDLAIRPARDGDAGLLVEFNRAMARETEGKELPVEIVTAGVRSLLANPGHGFYTVAESAGEVVGSLMITFEWSDWRNALFWWIQSVYVHPDFRRRGVYRRLYEHVRTRAREEGACGLRLYVERENAVAQGVYSALGMHRSGYLLFEEMLTG